MVRNLAAPHLAVDLPWWLLAGLFFVAEVSVVHLRFRRNAHSFSLSEIPLVIGLFFAAPAALVGGQLVGSFAALVFVRRQSPIKAAFNLALFALQTCLVLLMFHALAAGGATGVAAWLAALAAVFTSTLLGTALISLAIRLAEGAVSVGTRLEVLLVALTSAMTNGCLGLLAVTIVAVEPRAVFLLAIPTAALFAAYRVYTQERERHEDLALLFESSQALQATDDIDSAVQTLLGQVCRILRAELAELVLFPGDEATVALRTSLDGARVADLMAPLTAAETLECQSLAAAGASLARGAAAKTGYVRGRGFRDALIVPVQGRQRTLGVLVAANGPPRIGAFDKNHLRLLATLAGQLSVVLARSRLEQELRRRAFQDPLTELATRAFFAERIGQVLARRRRGTRQPCVLLVDLDDFTAVNDTHGLSVGDQVLSAVAERLRACLEPGDTAARLGGDEFGILLEATTRADAVALAERIEASLRVPFAVASAQLPLRASIGIALAERRHSSVEELVRNADAALYAAKRAARTKHAVFETRMLEAVIGRYALLSQLPSAIHGPQLVLRYQPIFDLRTGELAGLEALVRWQHPQLGLIGPDRFIPLAEESNLILALDLWVLREACSQLLRWRADSGDLGELYMSVNLSRAHFADSEFPSTILNVLQEVGMSPSQLVLEITESAVVRDLKAAQETLLPLRGLGARVAIDDFGTGYSSLSALHDFPVDMLKLAKPLVDKAADAGRGEALILAVTGLAQALSLNVVAEGIESAAQVDALRALGCDGGQGFYLAQPLEAAGVEAVLGGRRLKNGSKIRIAG